MTETNNKVRRGRILIALAALVVVVAAFFIFVTMNNERVSAQNAQYLEGSTQQSARRISEWMTDSQTEVRLLTSLYESSPRRLPSTASATWRPTRSSAT